MGWLWSSSAPSASSPPPRPPPQSTSPPQTTPETDPEVQTLLALLSSEASSSPSSPSSSASSSSTSSTSSSSSSPNAISAYLSSKLASPPPPPPVPHLSPLSESLLPTEMSCRQAFDLAWSCNSLGGQWNAVYRHGTMRSCSRHWDAFWFCMRAKSYGDGAGGGKEAAVREHYRRLEYEKYYAPGCRSSEDVWEARTERVRVGEAFGEGIEMPAVGDEEWRRMEEERRGKIRKDLGF